VQGSTNAVGAWMRRNYHLWKTCFIVLILLCFLWEWLRDGVPKNGGPSQLRHSSSIPGLKEKGLSSGKAIIRASAYKGISSHQLSICDVSNYAIVIIEVGWAIAV